LRRINTHRPVSPQHGGVVVYDDGVPRAVTTPAGDGANRIEFSASPFVLYGQNVETTEFGFRKMTVPGTASDRSDYNATFGTSSFAPGEASKIRAKLCMTGN
jgi:hypothetical protein